MIFATVSKADTIVMNDGEELDSWCVILNGQVEVTRRSGTIEHLQLGDRQAWLVDSWVKIKVTMVLLHDRDE